MSLPKKITAYATHARRAARESYYAKINWNAHLVPVVRRAIQEFGKDLQSRKCSPPLLTQLAEEISKGNMPQDANSDVGDSISIWLGRRPIAARTLSSLAGGSPILVEEGATLVFSQQAASGVVYVLLYPPSSAISKPEKSYYLLGIFQNPNLLTAAQVNQLLNDLIELDICCSTQTTPSLTCGKLLAKLDAREKALQGSDNKIFVYVKYLRYLCQALWKLYRAVHAAS